MLRDSPCFRPVVLVLVPALVWTSFPAVARAQVIAPSAPGESRSGAGVAMPIALPSETEMASPEKPAGAATQPLPPVLEGPIDPDKFICGSGDLFDLNFWGRQNFKQRVTVDPEGRIFIAKVGYVDIAGKSLRKARELVTAVVHRYFPGLSFDLSLVEPRSFLVHVVDNITQPGLHAARAVDRASTVVLRSGGLTPNASKRRISILHRDGTTTTVDLLLYNLTGDTTYNPYVMDGDVIRVPFEEIAVTIGGAVRRPGRYELVRSKDLDELLDLAGGLASSATRQLPLRLVRRDEHEREAQMDVAFPKEGLPRLPLRADDSVGVPSAAELQRTVLLIGAIAGAASADEATQLKRLPFVEKETVRALVERAGGVGLGADLSESYLLRKDGSQLPVDLEALLVRREFVADHALEMGDSLVVPYKRRSVVVEGAVFKPSAYPYNPRFGVFDYVAGAGGETRFAQDLSQVRLITPAGKTYSYNEKLKVGPGDIIVVPERNFSRSEVVQLVMAGAGLLLSGAALYFAATR